MVTFVESSATLGIAEGRSDTWGIAVADWSGDGRDDLWVGRHSDPEPRLYRSDWPTGRELPIFSDQFDLLPVARKRRFTRDKHAVAFADYDGDGRRDLFVSTGADKGRGEGDDDQLYHQLPPGSRPLFEDIAPEFGMQNRLGSGRFGLWFDYDRDGDLDLYVGHIQRTKERDPYNRNILWRNDGTGFQNDAVQAGVDDLGRAMSGEAADLDGDGYLDLVVVPGRETSLFWNRNGRKFDLDSLGHRPIASVAPGDYDNDGDLDLFLSGEGGQKDSVLLRNDGARTWTDVTPQAQLGGYDNGASAFWVDVNHDGWLDLFLARTARGLGGLKEPNSLFLNSGAGTFTDVASAAGVTGPTDSSSERVPASWSDYDCDGRADLTVVTQGSQDFVQAYLNRTETANHWITLRLRDPGSRNREARGAKVWLTSGALSQYRELTAPIGRWSQSPPYLIVGLGANTVIDSLRIRWPDGVESLVTDVAADRHYVVTKGEAEILQPFNCPRDR